MPALARVAKLSRNIFELCTSRISLSLASAPPNAFSDNKFPAPSQISLFLPSCDAYAVYHNSLSVLGDLANDLFWCFIFLPLDYFNVLIDEKPCQGSNRYEAVATSEIESTLIISIEVTDGVLLLKDNSDLCTDLPSLVSFRHGTRVTIIGDLVTALTESSICSVSMETLTGIGPHAFINCAFVMDV
jgi:hypothetical protein